MTRPPSIRNRRDIRGGMLHLAAEVVALVALVAVTALLAWLMLLF